MHPGKCELPERALQLFVELQQQGSSQRRSPIRQCSMQLRHDGGPWRPVLTTGQHAGRLLGGSGKAPQDDKFLTQEASVSHGTDWPYRALSVPGDELHKWVSVSGDRLAYSTCAVSWFKVGFSVIDRLSTYLSNHLVMACLVTCMFSSGHAGWCKRGCT